MDDPDGILILLAEQESGFAHDAKSARWWVWLHLVYNKERG